MLQLNRYKYRMKPYAHQLETLRRSYGKEEFALFLDMGVGKSFILINELAMLHDNGKIEAALIVAPKGVYMNWVSGELPKHLPKHVFADVVAWSPSQTKKNLTAQEVLWLDNDNLKILVMNVEAFSTEKGTLYARRFVKRWKTFMAVDESTTIKNRKAERTRSIVSVGGEATYRRIATGSPITQSPLDLYAQCEFLNLDLLGFQSYWTFQNRYARMVKAQGHHGQFNKVVGFQNLSELTESIQPFSYRVRKQDCLDLPDKVYVKRTVELTSEQRRMYDQMKTMALAEFEGQLVTTMNVLTTILRLQQICSGAVRMDDGSMVELPTNKMPELLQVVEETQGKIIIWANFTYDILAIEKELAKIYGTESVRTYYGNTPPELRQQMVEDFQDPAHPLRFFVGQPKTGGYGLTLTAAQTVVYYSNSYDLEVRIQSEDRAHRIGQTRKVTYVDLCTQDTVDEKILRALRSKINLATQVLAEGYREWIL